MGKVTERKTCWQSSDGREFTDQQAAVRHQAAIDAVSAFDLARRQLAEALAQECQTADNQFFDFGIFRTYFTIAGRHSPGSACVRSLSFARWSPILFENTPGGPVVRIKQADGEPQSFAIRELYADRRNADRELRSVIRDHIAILEARLDEKAVA